MRWDEYKTLCERYDHFSRYALEETRRALGSGAVYTCIGDVLRGESIPKPDDHRGGPEADYFLLEMEAVDVQSIIDCLSAIVGMDNDKTGGRLGHLRIVWEEYASFLSRRQ